jgi:hypothetical protein
VIWPELPKKVKIPFWGGVTYRVIIGDISDEHYGDCDHQKLIIRIDEDTAPHIRWETLFHEFLHIIELAYAIKLKDEEGDSVVDRVATGMLELLVANGWLDLG